MERRRFLQKSLKCAAGLAGTFGAAASVQSGIFERILSGVDQNHGTLLDRIDVVLRNAHTAFRGLYHGYGLGIHQILEAQDGPLPTIPERSHASWPHVHCACHCNVVANLGPEDGPEVSRFGGIADEVSQAYFARLFYSSVLPMVWKDQVTKYSGEQQLVHARRDMKYLMTYAFGAAQSRRRAIVLASAADKHNRQRLEDFRDLIYGLVDALESAWQQSDFHDNAIGREGGRQCPAGLNARGRREWCSGWCTSQGVPSNAAEGRGTARPWGPFHPYYPGPIPTIHDTIYGNLRTLFDPDLNVPHPEFETIVPPTLAGMYPLPGPRRDERTP